MRDSFKAFYDFQIQNRTLSRENLVFTAVLNREQIILSQKIKNEAIKLLEQVIILLKKFNISSCTSNKSKVDVLPIVLIVNQCLDGCHNQKLV